jgi:4-amino-4-deoxychorismate lyase
MAAPDRDRLTDEALQCLDGQGGEVLKLILTRGSGGRGYRPGTDAPRRIFSCHPRPTYPASYWRDGVRVRWCSTRLGWQPALAGLKHLNRLEQVLARQEWDDPTVPEGLMLDQGGAVAAGTQSNLFIVDDGRLLTPALEDCGVAGVMRGMLWDVATAQGLRVEQARLTAEDVGAAREVFLTNSLIGVWPVAQIKERACAQGPIARQLAGELGQYSAYPEEMRDALA